MLPRTNLAPRRPDLSYDEMKAALRTALGERGHVARPLPACPLELAAWRRAARAAARSMGRPVRTVVAEADLHAWLTDWPRDERETGLGVAPDVAALAAASVRQVSAAPAPRRAATA
jgi:hypothetical protein